MKLHGAVPLSVKDLLGRHYRFLRYWLGHKFWGHVAYPWAAAQATMPNDDEKEDRESNQGSHLRSCNEVTGYHVLATDGPVGHVDDFLIDEANWTIRHVEIDTSNWPGGKTALIPQWAVRNVSWPARRIRVDLPERRIRNSPTYEHSKLASVDEHSFSRYYAHAGPR